MGEHVLQTLLLSKASDLDAALARMLDAEATVTGMRQLFESLDDTSGQGGDQGPGH